VENVVQLIEEVKKPNKEHGSLTKNNNKRSLMRRSTMNSFDIKDTMAQNSSLFKNINVSSIYNYS
jgi:hypothetical protein